MPEATPSRRQAPSRLPIAYFTISHLALALACVLLAAYPQSVMGFFYHPWMMVPVHLVTLGWITASILGALYMIAPMALRCRLPQGRSDVVGCVAFVLGLWGMLAHFWIDSYGGMVWSVLWVIYVIGLVGWRVHVALRGAPIAPGVKLHLRLAFVNLLGVALLGVLMGFVKIGWMAVGSPLRNVFAHFHLAAVGWVLMMIVGVAYRLLPMFLPAAMPPQRASLASAGLLQAGASGLVLSWLTEWPLRMVSCVLVLAGVGVFLGQVVWMLRHRRRRAKGLPAVDVGMLHVAQGMVYLLLALGLGLSFVFGNWDAVTQLDWIPVYGVLALLGFAAQWILGMGARLFPLYAWLLALADGGFETPPTAPRELTSPAVQWATFIAWTAGVPLLAAAFLKQWPDLLTVAATLLGLAALGSAFNFGLALRRAKASVPEAAASAPSTTDDRLPGDKSRS